MLIILGIHTFFRVSVVCKCVETTERRKFFDETVRIETVTSGNRYLSIIKKRARARRTARVACATTTANGNTFRRVIIVLICRL